MQSEYLKLHSTLTGEQNMVYEKIMAAVSGSLGEIFFLYGYGGIGKTFMWKTLCSCLRGRGILFFPWLSVVLLTPSS